MFTFEEMKAIENASNDACEYNVECTNEACNAMSSGCAWG